MQLDKSILKEEAYIGEELMKDSKVSDLERKCFAIKQVVADGIFNLKDALAAYAVSEQDYRQYISRYITAEVATIFSDASPVMAATGSIAVISKIYEMFVAKIDTEGEIKIVVDHLRVLSEKISSGMIAVK
jgi:hypothetical protein